MTAKRPVNSHQRVPVNPAKSGSRQLHAKAGNMQSHGQSHDEMCAEDYVRSVIQRYLLDSKGRHAR